MRNNEQQLFFDLLEKSKVFDDRAKLVIRRAAEEQTLPNRDFQYLLDVMKLEQNMYAVVDSRADMLLNELKKKYSVTK